MTTLIRFSAVLAALALAACGSDAPPPSLELAARPDVSGITRTTLRDDSATTVTRVHFAPGAAEPVHVHPFDLLVVPLQSAPVSLVLDATTIEELRLGEVQFIPREVPHQLINNTAGDFELIAIAIR